MSKLYVNLDASSVYTLDKWASRGSAEAFHAVRRKALPAWALGDSSSWRQLATEKEGTFPVPQQTFDCAPAQVHAWSVATTASGFTRLDASTGNRRALQIKIAAMQNSSRGEETNEYYVSMVGTGDFKDEVMLVEQWANDKAMARHLRSAGVARLLTVGRLLVDDATLVRLREITPVCQGDTSQPVLGTVRQWLAFSRT